jgi:hypothetical protein
MNATMTFNLFRQTPILSPDPRPARKINIETTKRSRKYIPGTAIMAVRKTEAGYACDA